MPYRKISRGPPELTRIIFKVADVVRLKNIDYSIDFDREDVDCYYDGIYTVSIRGYRDGHRVRKRYFIKWHSDPKTRIAFNEAHRREYLFYQRIIPKFLEIQRHYNIIEGLKTKFLNCEFASVIDGTEALAISDPRGFKIHNRFERISLEHVSLALKNLAKVHALSFVLEKSQPEEFEHIKKACRVDVQYSDVKLMSASLLSFYNTSVSVISDSEARKKLQHLAPYIFHILNKCAMPVTKYSSVCHGDCWNNNILYQYKKTRPVDVIFVDWQLLRYASPVTDISYYLYMSTDHEFRSKYYDHVLSLYYGTLSAVLRQCDVDVNEVYPDGVFRQHLEDFSVYGLIEALISMKIITAETEEALKMIQVKYEQCEEGLRESESQNVPLYVERVNDVVNDFFARNYSLDAVLSK